MRSLFRFVLLIGVSASACAQWQVLDAHTTADFRGVHYVGDGVAWVSGTSGTVLRTEDMGKTWTHCVVPAGAEKLDFRGVQAFDAKTAIVMSSGPGELSRLYKTVDGCATWKLVFTNPDKDGFFDAVSIRFERNNLIPSTAWGSVLGDPVNGQFAVFSTVDGGDTWFRRVARKRGAGGEGCRVDGFVAQAGDAAFAASNESMISFAPYFLFVTGGSEAKLAYVDHFDLDFSFCHDSAKYINLPLAHGSSTRGAFAIAAKSVGSYFPLRLMVVGGDYQQPDRSDGTAVFLATRDGVHVPFTSDFDVRTPLTSPHGYRSSVVYDAQRMMWVTVGPNGTDVSSDDGRNWKALRPEAADQTGADRNWNALSLPFVVGPHGRIGLLRESALAGLSDAKGNASTLATRQ